MQEFELSTGEELIIDEAVIKLVEIRKGRIIRKVTTESRARLGVTAPKHIPIHRKEVHDAIRRVLPKSQLERA